VAVAWSLEGVGVVWSDRGVMLVVGWWWVGGHVKSCVGGVT
jgi:hypothetical protein